MFAKENCLTRFERIRVVNAITYDKGALQSEFLCKHALVLCAVIHKDRRPWNVLEFFNSVEVGQQHGVGTKRAEVGHCVEKTTNNCQYIHV